MQRYIFTDPFKVLSEPISVRDVFERYRTDNDKIDYLNFMDDIFSIESSSSYLYAFLKHLTVPVPVQPLCLFQV